LIIAHFVETPGEKGNDRFRYIADRLDSSREKVEILTSSFSHQVKEQRKIPRQQLECLGYQLTMLFEPGYPQNVSLKRFYSHFVMGRNLKKYLETRNKPDVIYCAVPSLDIAKVAAEYAKKNNIYFIIDVQDLWPEAFKMVFKVPFINDILFYPMQKQADYIYRVADKIIAVSQTYTDRALRVNNKSRKGHSIFLGTDLAIFDMLVEKNKIKVRPVNEIWLAYVGTLGHSYDLTCTIDALKILQEKGIKNIKFVVMGDGPLKSKFEKYARDKGIYTEFTGRLDYGQMVGMLSSCDIAVNPITKDAAQSIINKHADYAAASLPVLNTQECLEYKNLIKQYNAGFNCENNNAVDLADKLLKLYENKSLRHIMGKNSRRLAEEKFDRSATYQEIINIIKNVSFGGRCFRNVIG
jgi:glycosyltransferase involved in cell wall biosynthesis